MNVRDWKRACLRGALALAMVVGYAQAQERRPPEQLALPPANSGQAVTPPPPKAADQSEQKTAPTQPETQPKEKGAEKKGTKKHELEGLVVAPIPISSPAIGSGIVPVVAYVFPFSREDKVSLPLPPLGRPASSRTTAAGDSL